ncbi:MAG TPA: hypothetical protein VMU94_22850 [Streptosporangiaceae bacterium]|nr:hypothetical protein [Streptosporangiaceae bacterium]
MMADDLDADIRLLRADDAAADQLRSFLGAENAREPVALIEPIRNAFVQRGEEGYGIRLAIATKMGLPLAGPIGSRLALGWTFGPRQGKWELTDPTGALIARGVVSARDSAGEPAWTAQAMAVGQILIAYGMRVGVRIPDGVPASSYHDLYRAAELRKSLVGQQACTAIVNLSQQLSAFRLISQSRFPDWCGW